MSSRNVTDKLEKSRPFRDAKRANSKCETYTKTCTKYSPFEILLYLTIAYIFMATTVNQLVAGSNPARGATFIKM